MVLIPIAVELPPPEAGSRRKSNACPALKGSDPLSSRTTGLLFPLHPTMWEWFVSPPRLSTYISHLAKCFAEFSGLRSALLFLRGGGVGCIGHRGRRFPGGLALSRLRARAKLLLLPSPKIRHHPLLGRLVALVRLHQIAGLHQLPFVALPAQIVGPIQFSQPLF